MTDSYFFLDDYSEGAHPSILEALVANNSQQEHAYGCDTFSQEAIHLLKERMEAPHAAIHFVTGGTQANILGLSSILRPHESIIATTQAHIHDQEAGAIEATGHKINLIPPAETPQGKATPETVQKILEHHQSHYMVHPKVLYISQATELGTIYCKAELEALASFCRKNHLYLYLDGARLGVALTSSKADFTLTDIARCCDIFYLGGTKNGAFLGEAMVILHPELQSYFRTYLRQRGALLAKSRLIGIGFQQLFKGDLFTRNATHANKMAAQLAAGVAKQGFHPLFPLETNQLFLQLPEKIAAALHPKFRFYYWDSLSAPEGYRTVRLVTSWATKELAIEAFLEEFSQLTRENFHSGD